MFAVNLRREGTNGCFTAFCFSCYHLLLLSVVFLLKLLPRQHRYVLITLVLHLFRELNYSQFNDLDDSHFPVVNFVLTVPKRSEETLLEKMQLTT